MIRDFILGLTAWDVVCIGTGWLLLAAVIAPLLGRGMKPAEVVHRMTELPPVPPILPRDYEPQPPVSELSGEALDDRLFEALDTDDALWLLNLDGEAA